jgi:hypothetical protein
MRGSTSAKGAFKRSLILKSSSRLLGLLTACFWRPDVTSRPAPAATASPGGGNRLAKHFGAFIPTGRAVSPITKTNWEGTGVEPDVKVSADQALRTAQVMALKKAIEKTTDDELKGALQREIDALQKEVSQAEVKK